MRYLGWNRARLLVALAFAAAAFAASFVLGYAITLMLGPGTSGVATIVVTTIMVVIGARIAETPGVFTVMVTAFTLLAIPTTMFGPPGVQKLAIGVATGVVYDLAWMLFRRGPRLRRWSLPIAAALATAASIMLIFLLMRWLHHPRADWMRKFLSYLAPVYAALGFLGALLGDAIFNRNFARDARVRSLRGETDTSEEPYNADRGR